MIRIVICHYFLVSHMLSNVLGQQVLLVWTSTCKEIRPWYCKSRHLLGHCHFTVSLLLIFLLNTFKFLTQYFKLIFYLHCFRLNHLKKNVYGTQSYSQKLYLKLRWAVWRWRPFVAANQLNILIPVGTDITTKFLLTLMSTIIIEYRCLLNELLWMSG